VEKITDAAPRTGHLPISTLERPCASHHAEAVGIVGHTHTWSHCSNIPISPQSRSAVSVATPSIGSSRLPR
jgi:hypothetical protein